MSSFLTAGTAHQNFINYFVCYKIWSGLYPLTKDILLAMKEVIFILLSTIIGNFAYDVAVGVALYLIKRWLDEHLG